MKTVVDFISLWKAKQGRYDERLDASILQEALIQAGYPSISIPVNSGFMPVDWNLYYRGMRWCAEQMSWDEYTRIRDRMFFMDSEKAMMFKLMFT